MSDLAQTSIRWMRKHHPVDLTGSDSKASIEVCARVKNAGSATWSSPDWNVRAHVLTAAGDTYRDPAMTGIAFSTPLAAGGTADVTVTILSDPDTDGLTPAALCHPDTLIVVDVVKEGVAWLGEVSGGHVGQRYVRDALRDMPAGADFEVEAIRSGFASPLRAKVTVPTSGVPLDVVFAAVPSGQTHYLLQVTLAATVAQQRVTFKRTPSGGSEESLEEWVVPLVGAPAIDLLYRKANAGDQYRVCVDANAAGGTCLVLIARLVLPWEEEL